MALTVFAVVGEPAAPARFAVAAVLTAPRDRGITELMAEPFEAAAPGAGTLKRQFRLARIAARFQLRGRARDEDEQRADERALHGSTPANTTPAPPGITTGSSATRTPASGAAGGTRKSPPATSAAPATTAMSEMVFWVAMA